MKLYAVSDGEASDRAIHAIFFRKEAAEAYAQTLYDEYRECWIKYMESHPGTGNARLFTAAILEGIAARERWEDMSQDNDIYRVEEFDPGLGSHP